MERIIFLDRALEQHHTGNPGKGGSGDLQAFRLLERPNNCQQQSYRSEKHGQKREGANGIEGVTVVDLLLGEERILAFGVDSSTFSASADLPQAGVKTAAALPVRRSQRNQEKQQGCSHEQLGDAGEQIDLHVVDLECNCLNAQSRQSPPIGVHRGCRGSQQMFSMQRVPSLRALARVCCLIASSG